MKTSKTSVSILILLLGLMAPTMTLAAQQNPITTVFLVRHAEKVADGSSDPALTKEGTARAEELAYLLKHVKLDAVYSWHIHVSDNDYERRAVNNHVKARLAALSRRNVIELAQLSPKACQNAGIIVNEEYSLSHYFAPFLISSSQASRHASNRLPRPSLPR